MLLEVTLLAGRAGIPVGWPQKNCSSLDPPWPLVREGLTTGASPRGSFGFCTKNREPRLPWQQDLLEGG